MPEPCGRPPPMPPREPVAGDPMQALRTAVRGEPGQVLARIGLASRGGVYLLMGALAVLLALGTSRTPVDQKGAIARVLSLPAGTVIALLMIIGFLGYAVWRGSEAAFGVVGPGGRRPGPRVRSAARALIYLGLAATGLLALAGSRTEQADQQRDAAARVMTLPGGSFLLAIVGLVIVAIGAMGVIEGWRCAFLRLFQARPAPQLRIIRHLGRAGTMARGAVIAAVGGLVLMAALTSDPSKAGGIDTTMRTLLEMPMGGALVLLAGVGLALFGIYGITEAAFRRVS